MRVRARVKFRARARAVFGFDGKAGRRVAVVVERDEAHPTQGVARDLVGGGARVFGLGVFGCVRVRVLGLGSKGVARDRVYPHAARIARTG